jgi:lambda family phage portal protein
MSWAADYLDAAISVVSPNWAAHRKLARLALAQSERLTTYRDAMQRRIDRAATARGLSGDDELELGYDRRSIVDRARLAERESLIASELLDRSTDGVLGEGLRLLPQTDDDDWNEQAQVLWREWCDHDADSRGIDTFDELAALVYRSYLRDGDVGSVLLDDGTVRIVESDEISDPRGYTRSDMVDGVELDGGGRPVAYHVYAPETHWVGTDRRLLPTHTRIPAEDVVFMQRRNRVSATRGLSAFAGRLWLLEQLDGLVEADTVKARTAACFSLVIKKQEGAAALARLNQTTTSSNEVQPEMKLAPGKFITLKPGEDVSPIAPAGPSADLLQLLRLLIRFAGSRFATGIEILLGDYSEANLSSLRAGMAIRQRALKRLAKKMTRWYRDHYYWKLINFIEAGELDAHPQALKHLWIGPGEDWLDPVTDVQAALAAIDGNLGTHADFAMRRGYSLMELIKQRKRERKFISQAKLPEVRSTLTRDPGTQAPGVPPAKKSEAGADPSKSPKDEKKSA